jgi:hypothetical protein
VTYVLFASGDSIPTDVLYIPGILGCTGCAIHAGVGGGEFTNNKVYQMVIPSVVDACAENGDVASAFFNTSLRLKA